MSDRNKETLADRSRGTSPSEIRQDENERLTIFGAIMIAAAHMDGDFADRERTKFIELVKRHFGLTPEAGEEVLEASEAAFARAGVVHSFVNAAKKSLSHKERVELLEMIFEIVFSDGVVHGHEASILRHLAKELDIPDDEYRDLRKLITTRLGLQSS
jgi:uncharacterized tellurite resistance protein B-like protein